MIVLIGGSLIVTGIVLVSGNAILMCDPSATHHRSCSKIAVTEVAIGKESMVRATLVLN